MQVTANRLQLGKCRLNHYLHTMGKHDTGLCDICDVQETVQHYITGCKNDITNLVKQQLCIKANIDITVANIIRNNNIVSQICRLTDKDI